MPPEAPPPPAPAPKDAPPPANGATPPEPPPLAAGGEGEPAPGEPAKAKDRASIARIAKKLRDERRGLKEQGEAWAKEKADLEAKLAAGAPVETELRQLREERAAFLKDPIAWAAKNGGPDAEKAIRSYVETSTPEAAIREANERAAAAEKAAQQASKELHEFLEGQKRKDEEQTKAQAEAHRKNLSEGFSRSILANSKKYPYLCATHSAEEIAEKAAKTHDIAMQNGETLSFEDVAAAFENFARQVYEKREQSLKSLLTPSEEGEPGSAPGIQAKPAPGSGRRDEVGPGTSSTPPQPKKRTSEPLTRKQQREADIAALKAASERDRKARAADNSKH